MTEAKTGGLNPAPDRGGAIGPTLPPGAHHVLAEAVARGRGQAGVAVVRVPRMVKREGEGLGDQDLHLNLPPGPGRGRRTLLTPKPMVAMRGRLEKKEARMSKIEGIVNSLILFSVDLSFSVHFCVGLIRPPL